MCTYDNKNVENLLCYSLTTTATCLMFASQQGAKSNVTVVDNAIVEYPGQCGCPSDCSNSFRGKCVSDECVCSKGYAGKDCTTVSCSAGNDCNGHGRCQSQFGVDYCVCDSGFGGIDCASPTPALPSIPLVGDKPQYNKWDDYDDANPLFGDSDLSTIWIDVAPEDLKAFMEPKNMHTKEYARANMTIVNQRITERIENVGFRPKGGGSRAFQKKSWKISFNKFESGRKIYQQKKLLLKAMAMTPSYLRERLTRDTLYAIGVPVQRASYAVLYVNGLYRGAYTSLEEIDDRFLKSRFGKHADEHPLWKCSAGAFLFYAGTSCSAYSKDQYKPSNDAAEANCQPLIDLTRTVTRTANPQFAAQIESILDVDSFLRALASQVLTANWDSCILTGNNYYLYLNEHGRFVVIEQDNDLSMGAVGFVDAVLPNSSQRQATGNVFDYGKRSLGRLAARVLAIDKYRDVYAGYVSKLLDYLVVDDNAQSVFMQRQSAMHAAVAPYVEQDYWHRLDVLYTVGEFYNNVGTSNVTREFIAPKKPTKTLNYVFELNAWNQLRFSSAKEQLSEAGYSQ
jgi:spore coat protein H